MLAGPRLEFGEEATSEWLASYLSCLDQMDPNEEDEEAGECSNLVLEHSLHLRSLHWE